MTETTVEGINEGGGGVDDGGRAIGGGRVAVGPSGPPTPPISPGNTTTITEEGPWSQKEKMEASGLMVTAQIMEKLNPEQIEPMMWPMIVDAWRRVQGYIYKR